MILLRKVLRGGCWFPLWRARAPAPHIPSSRSSAVGGIWARSSAGGLKVVQVMASGAKISRWQKRSSDSSARRSRAMLRIMNPISLYSARVAGFAVSGVERAACRSSARVPAFRNNFSYAGRPEVWVRSMRRVTSWRRGSLAASRVNSGTMAETWASRSSRPRW